MVGGVEDVLDIFDRFDGIEISNDPPGSFGIVGLTTALPALALPAFLGFFSPAFSIRGTLKVAEGSSDTFGVSV
jgi:hypothetical protein